MIVDKMIVDIMTADEMIFYKMTWCQIFKFAQNI